MRAPETYRPSALVFLKRSLTIYRLSNLPAAGILASNKGGTVNGSALSQRILARLAAYFASCSENFVSEGQESALRISPALRAYWY
jgi:hypothetical protein